MSHRSRSPPRRSRSRSRSPPRRRDSRDRSPPRGSRRSRSPDRRRSSRSPRRSSSDRRERERSPEKSSTTEAAAAAVPAESTNGHQSPSRQDEAKEGGNERVEDGGAIGGSPSKPPPVHEGEGAPRPPKSCFDFSQGRCYRSECKYAHDGKPLPPAIRDYGARLKNLPNGPAPRGVCYEFWNHGSCRNTGRGCQNRHEHPPNRGGPPPGDFRGGGERRYDDRGPPRYNDYRRDDRDRGYGRDDRRDDRRDYRDRERDRDRDRDYDDRRRDRSYSPRRR